MHSGTDQNASGALISELRAAEAEALARAGEDQRRIAKAQGGAEADREAMALLRRRIAAEELAGRQALARAEAEREAETAAAERAHAERLLEIAARVRVDAEEKALQDAKRREFAAHELASAARDRVERERQAEAMARERAEADRHAAELALERQRDDASLEAARLARQAADVDARQQAARRQAAERDAALLAERVERLGALAGGAQPMDEPRSRLNVGSPLKAGDDSPRSATKPWWVVAVALLSAGCALWLLWPAGKDSVARPGSLTLERAWPARSSR